MDEFNIENIVFSTKISDDLNIENLSKIFLNSKYNIDEFSGLIIDFDNPKCAIFIFPNGRIVCTGLKDLDDIEIISNKIIDDIEKHQISIFDDINITIENIIASTSHEDKLNLDAISESIEKVEYEPEKFPGLVHKMENPSVVLLLFSSGKIVCTGGKSIKDASDAIDAFKDKLSSLVN